MLARFNSGDHLGAKFLTQLSIMSSSLNLTDIGFSGRESSHKSMLRFCHLRIIDRPSERLFSPPIKRNIHQNQTKNN